LTALIEILAAIHNDYIVIAYPWHELETFYSTGIRKKYSYGMISCHSRNNPQRKRSVQQMHVYLNEYWKHVAYIGR
jgi:hypothetical protein